ncbi:putative translation Initiation factor eIF-4e [Helianthus annuus]|uniref:Translation Initiation factor eIF-4e n=1 Tax=Helianthus annuus TaxID=4232 RepID=A0A9K3MVT2_HELAN|nr:putative translation Initiation factor eIF-4e [Helianthus annuus]KAJ0489171.1 putative translation Initiation factor eIF-4e [Helianthus annuus]KAJ0505047.1 putative translation Initiation factor eIF-4e [Helianthus annuus]KAJ0674732.1 putative translation Initiation factor eIF-4e [Helianthus annuus]KAJ0862439.1 putative translation Initiation factor eIF-4e [Helianthus annuus]
MGSRPLCAGGGMWTMTFPKSKSDKYWAYMFDHGDEICEAVVM